MKAAVFIAMLDNGRTEAVSASSILPVQDLAAEARRTGLLNGQRIKEGIVLSTWRPPCNHFKLHGPLAAEPKPLKRKAK